MSNLIYSLTFILLILIDKSINGHYLKSKIRISSDNDSISTTTFTPSSVSTLELEPQSSELLILNSQNETKFHESDNTTQSISITNSTIFENLVISNTTLFNNVSSVSNVSSSLPSLAMNSTTSKIITSTTVVTTTTRPSPTAATTAITPLMITSTSALTTSTSSSNTISESITNPCLSHPCENNGKCQPINETDFTCECNHDIAFGQFCQMLNPCWTFPCKRGSTCIPTRNQLNSYTCKCTNISYGRNCEYHRNKDTNSTIFTWKQMQDLKKLINYPLYLNLSLLYQATRDGFQSSNFHSLVSNKSPTLTVVKTVDSYIFGGLTFTDWSVNDKYRGWSFKYDSRAFIFSLINTHNTPVILNITRPEYAIFASSLHGPVFGAYDFYIYIDNTTQTSYGSSNLGNSYELPFNLTYGSVSAQRFLAGSSSYKISEIETYHYDYCWNIECKNNGTCQSNGSTAKCICSVNFTGKNCENKIVDSKEFSGSKILTDNQSIDLLKLINFPLDKNYTLLYQGSRDGFSGFDFHSRVDYIPNTLTLVKTSKSYIFGGFTTQEWSGNWNYKYDDKAFLFSLINPSMQPVRLNITRPQYAIYCNSYYGPIFGAFFNFYNGECDLFVHNYMSQDLYGSSNLGNSYELPANMTFASEQSQAFLAGSYNFKIIDIETYSVDPCIISQCKNGASCVSNSSTYSCVCIDNFYGRNCEYKQLNSTLFANSTILTQEQSIELSDLTGLDKNSNWTLIYQASVDTFKSSAFHYKVDGILNTLSIFKTTLGYIFGGYTTNDWSGFAQLKNDSNSFLFSLINPYYKPTRLNTTSSAASIYASVFNGPSFGEGSDLYTISDTNQMIGYSYLGNSYQRPSFLNYFSSSSFLTGTTTSFQIFELEVYSINPCQYIQCENEGYCELNQCKCKYGYHGSRCQYKTYISSRFMKSTILNQNLEDDFLNLLNTTFDVSFDMIYQASIDGFSAYDFHSKCDNKSNTLILIKTNNSNVFGGYTQADWFGPSTYDPNSFLFSLINSYNKSIIMNVIQPERAIYPYSYFGPTFGIGYDLYTAQYSNYGNSFSNLGYTFSLPFDLKTDTNEAKSFLAGSFYYYINEIEVYTISGCWNAPCQNNGKCITTQNSYKCVCVDKFYGKNCEYKPLNSTLFNGSTILDDKLDIQLLNLTILKNKIEKWTLIYQASRDGFEANTFHSKCDQIYGTLIVIKSSNGNIFGGYTEADWSGNGLFKQDSKAFLFTLNNLINSKHKLEVISSSKAIYANPNYGPIFGSGYDLFISDKANLYLTSYSSIGSTYRLPTDCQNSYTLFGGSYNFIINEIEVYA